jgi:5-methylcytosine-specific restriction protein A
MKTLQSIIYRYLTDNDFFTMYKPRGTERGGGGQLYIDFLTSHIPVAAWEEFFDGVEQVSRVERTNGPEWIFPIYSVGLPQRTRSQILRIYQRRPASVCIPNQNINTRNANRVYAWLPVNGFPEPTNPRDRHSVPDGLGVFLARTKEGEIWAGWFRREDGGRAVCKDERAFQQLSEMLGDERSEGDVGIVSLPEDAIFLDPSEAGQPLSSASADANRDEEHSDANVSLHDACVPLGGDSHPGESEERMLDMLFGEDRASEVTEEQAPSETIAMIRRRNRASVAPLKMLYAHSCQITGDEFTFLKHDGTPYTEAHHLIPLGEGGADDPRNMIIVSPLIHRMLHYAKVEGIDLGRIKIEDGVPTLEISINDSAYIITWHPEHARRVTD